MTGSPACLFITAYRLQNQRLVRSFARSVVAPLRPSQCPKMPRIEAFQGGIVSKKRTWLPFLGPIYVVENARVMNYPRILASQNVSSTLLGGILIFSMCSMSFFVRLRPGRGLVQI